MSYRGPTPAASVPTERARPTDDLSRLCGEVAGIVRRAWGRGPVKTASYWAGPGMIVLLFEDGHTDAEKTLRAAGHVEELRAGRRLLLELVEDDLRAAIEQIAGRPVLTMLAATRLDPDLSAAIFLLESGEPTDRQQRLADLRTSATAQARELGDEARALDAQRRQVQRRIDARRKTKELDSRPNPLGDE